MYHFVPKLNTEYISLIVSFYLKGPVEFIEPKKTAIGKRPYFNKNYFKDPF